MPNYQSVTSVMINNVPSAPFSMSFLPPMGQPNTQLSDALKRLSAAKYGKPRAQVEKDIFARLGAADAEKKAKVEALKKTQQQRMTGVSSASNSSPSGGSSFLDEWLAKRQQLGGTSKPAATAAPAAFGSAAPPLTPATPINQSSTASAPSFPFGGPQEQKSQEGSVTPPTPPAAQPSGQSESQSGLHLRGNETNHDSEISIKLR
jgi:hypothetical protein